MHRVHGPLDYGLARSTVCGGPPVAAAERLARVQPCGHSSGGIIAAC
jgi:hypothetical protein